MADGTVEKVAGRLTFDIAPASQALELLEQRWAQTGSRIVALAESAGQAELVALENIGTKRSNLTALQQAKILELQQDGDLKRLLLQTAMHKDMEINTSEHNARIQTMEATHAAALQAMMQATTVKMMTDLQNAEVKQQVLLEQSMLKRQQLSDRIFQSQEAHEQRMITLRANSERATQRLEEESLRPRLSMERMHYQALQENEDRDQRARAERISAQLREIKALYDMKEMSAQESLERVEILMSEEAAFFAANEDKKLQALKLSSTLRRDIQKAETDMDKLHYKALQEDREREERAVKESINTQLREIQTFHRMRLATAEETTQRILALWAKESEYFQANQAERLRSMEMYAQAQGEIAKRQIGDGRGAVRSSMDSANTGFSVGGWMTGMIGFEAIMGMYNALVKGMKDVEEGAAGLHQVFEEQITTHEQLNEVTMEFVGVAKKYGEAVNEVMEGTKLWGRQYKDIQTVMTLTNASTLLTVVDNVKLKDSMRGLEGTMNSLGLAAESQSEAFANSMRIVDSWSALAHKAAVSATDLVRATERSAGAAHEVGITFDQLQALITSGVKNTGLTGENIGNMLKSLFASIHTKDAEDALSHLNISLTEIGQNGEKQFRPMFEVLLDLSQKLQTADQSQQKLLETISGGKYQWSKAASMLADYNTIIDAYATSINSAGAAQEYVQAQMHTLGRDIERLRVAFAELAGETDNNGLGAFLKGIVEGLTHLITGLQQLPPAAGQALLVIGGLLVALKSFSALMNTLEPLAKGLILVYNGLAAASGKVAASQTAQAATSPAVVAGLEAEVVAARTATAAFTALDVVSGGLVILLGALVTGVTMWAMSEGEAADATREHSDALREKVGIAEQEYNLAKQKEQFMETAIRQEERLKQALEDTTLSEENRQKVMGDLVDLYHSVGKATDNEALKQVNASNVKNQSLTTEQRKMADLVETKRQAYNHVVEINQKEIEADLQRTKQLISGINSHIQAMQNEVMARVNALNFFEKTAYYFKKAFGADDSAKELLDASSSVTEAITEQQEQLKQAEAKQAQLEYNLANSKLDTFRINAGDGPGDLELPKTVDFGWDDGKKQSAADFARTYRNEIEASQAALAPFLARNKELAATIDQLSIKQQNLADMFGYGSAEMSLVSEGTGIYLQRLKTMQDQQEALHATNERMRAERTEIGQKMQELNPSGSDRSTLGQGQQDALKALQDEYDRLGTQIDENSKKWQSASRDMVHATQDWLSNIYKAQENMFLPLDRQIKRIEAELKTDKAQNTLVDHRVKYGDASLDTMAQAGANYRAVLEDVIEKQKTLHEQADLHRSQINDLTYALNTLDPASAGYAAAVASLTNKIEDHKMAIADLQEGWVQAETDAQSYTETWLQQVYSIEENGINRLAKQVKTIDNTLKTLKAQMTLDDNKIKHGDTSADTMGDYAEKYDKYLFTMKEKQKLVQQEIDEHKKSIRELTTMLNTLDPASAGYAAAVESLTNKIQEHEDSVASLGEQYVQLETDAQSAVDTVLNDVIDGLKSGYEAEHKRQLEDLEAQYKRNEQAIRDRIKSLNDQKDAIDENIEALRDQWKAEDDLKKLQDLQNEKDQVMSQRDHEIVGMDGKLTYTYDVAKVTELDKKIAEEQTRIAHDEQIKRLEDQKRTLADQIRQQEEASNSLREQYDRDKQALDEYWAYRLDRDRLKHEADNLILQQGHEKALELARTFRDQMNDIYEQIHLPDITAGGNLADLLGLKNAGAGSVGGGSTTSAPATGGASGGSTTQTSGGSGMVNGHSVVVQNGRVSVDGFPVDHINPNSPEGQWAAQHGVSLGTGGEIPRDGMAMLHQDEIVVNSPIVEKIRKMAEPPTWPDFGNMLKSASFALPDFSALQNSAPPTQLTQTVQVTFKELVLPNVRTSADAGGILDTLASMGQQLYNSSFRAGEGM